MLDFKMRRKFDEEDDQNLKKNIKEKYGFFSQNQYEFSKRLILCLIDRNLTNREFAEITGLSEGTISNYTSGKRMAGGFELEVIARKLYTTPNYLLGLTDCLTFSAEEINKIIGLSENAMKVLWSLNHNEPEVKDLMDPMEISNLHKNKLNIFSLFISDQSNFLDFLTYFESYVITKQKINEINNKKEKGLNYKQETKYLEDKLLRN